MRRALTIAAVSIAIASTLPVAAQQPSPPAATARPADPGKPAAEPKRTPRAARATRHRTGYMVRRRRESICSIVNGWRAFNNPYDPKGYFYTGRVCCCG
jgi:hypothetical protein